MSSGHKAVAGDQRLHAAPDRILSAIACVSARHDADGLPWSSYAFDTLILGVRLRPGDRVAGLPGMFGPARVAGLTPTAWVDVVEGPDPVLEALLPADHGGRDRFVSSSAFLYCYWDPLFGGKLVVVDRATRRGFVWQRSAGTLPSWEVARPFLHVFKAFSPNTGLMPVHAAAVAYGDAGVLIVGRGGVGKTSMALACLEAGWRYIGDDFLLLDAAPLRAINLYRSARVREDMFERLGKSMAAAVALSTDSGEVKGELDLGRLATGVAASARIAAIVLPRRAGAPAASIAPIRKSVALQELIATTLAVLPADAAATYDGLARAVRDTPCFAVDPGPSLTAVPAALAALIPGA